jgi:hypothetical protein
MEPRSRKGSLRLARMAAESALKERVLPKHRLDGAEMNTIVRQLRSIVEKMQAEWENDPVSSELWEGFRLLLDYLDCLQNYRPRDAGR